MKSSFWRPMLIFLITLGSCENFDLSLKDYAMEHTPVLGTNYEFRTGIVPGPAGTGKFVIPPFDERGEISELVVHIQNSRNYNLVLNLTTDTGDPPPDNIACELIGMDKALITIPEATREREYRLKLGIATADGKRTFDDYVLPPIVCRYFNTELTDITIAKGAGYPDFIAGTGILAPVFSADTLAYTVNVEPDIGAITITGTRHSLARGIRGNLTNKSLDYGENRFSLIVTADNEVSEQEYVVRVIRRYPRDAKDITGFGISSGQTETAGNLITVTMPENTDLTTSLSPTFDITGVSCSPPSGSSENFDGSYLSPKIYTVTAEDGSTQNYQVRVILAGPRQVTFSNFSANETTDLISDPNKILIQNKNTGLTINIGSYSGEYKWYLDDNLLSGETGQGLSKTAREFTSGNHEIRCRLLNNQGYLYAEKSVRFKVVP